MLKFNFLVIGGGIAGLSYALKVAPYGTVAVLCKKEQEQSSTSFAQGGIAAVALKEDDFEKHITDTLNAGAGLCRRESVEIVVREGPDRIKDLINWGVNFDREGDAYHLHREGGHSMRRIYHAADSTGREIQQTLLERAHEEKNIYFFEHTTAIDLITTSKVGLLKYKGSVIPNRVLGAYVLMPEGEIEVFVADKVLVATGGAGKVYLYTSNPDVATGDGIAMCYRAGVRVANMEFFQFHPTCLYHPEAKSFLLSEALRGEGAKLRRINGEEFMHRYNPAKELAPRDIVARAIDNEMKTYGEEHVLLDITHRPASFIKEHFPTIYQTCLQYGYDMTVQPIPVVPAAHYCCGGVLCDEFGLTDIDSLYVAGESSCTGLHGANRLASNSLLEGIVYGHRAAQHSVEHLDQAPLDVSIPVWDPGTARDSDEEVVITQNWDEIRRFMWNYVGIVRSNKRLERALRRSQIIEQEIKDYYWNFKVTSDLIELRNLSLVANLVILSALKRHESRGLHYTIDYPRSDDKCIKDTVLIPLRN